jgi:hypothetical protein
MKLAVAVLTIVLTGVIAAGQAPTLQVVTADPNLPSELYYGNVKVKPLRVRPGTNPPQMITIDDSDFYVQQQYVDFLNRMPDASGFGFWNTNITSCGADAACTEVKRIDTSAAFFLSIEFQQTGYLVEKMYKAAFGTKQGSSTLGGQHNLQVPIVTLSQFTPDTKTIGQGVVVGQTGWDTQLETNKQNFATAFVQRGTFTSAFPTSLSPSTFVNQLFQNAGVTPTAQELQTALNEFSGAADTSNVTARGKALRDVAESASLNSAEFSPAFVLMQYFGYLRRDPNTGPDTDYTGFEFWLQKMNQFNGDFRGAEMVRAFISASEYRGRF